VFFIFNYKEITERSNVKQMWKGYGVIDIFRSPAQNFFIFLSLRKAVIFKHTFIVIMPISTKLPTCSLLASKEVSNLSERFVRARHTPKAKFF
jgi:hypothetical protein